MTLTKGERAELAVASMKLRGAALLLREEFAGLRNQLIELEHAFKRKLDAYNAVLADVDVFVAGVASRLRDDVDGKSERWQESDAGIAARDMADAWTDVVFSSVAWTGIIPPEMEDDLCHDKALDQLPTESD